MLGCFFFGPLKVFSAWANRQPGSSCAASSGLLQDPGLWTPSLHQKSSGSWLAASRDGRRPQRRPSKSKQGLSAGCLRNLTALWDKGSLALRPSKQNCLRLCPTKWSCCHMDGRSMDECMDPFTWFWDSCTCNFICLRSASINPTKPTGRLAAWCDGITLAKCRALRGACEWSPGIGQKTATDVPAFSFPQASKIKVWDLRFRFRQFKRLGKKKSTSKKRERQEGREAGDRNAAKL